MPHMTIMKCALTTMKENPYSAQYLLHISTLYKKLGEEANIRGEKILPVKMKEKKNKN